MKRKLVFALTGVMVFTGMIYTITREAPLVEYAQTMPQTKGERFGFNKRPDKKEGTTQKRKFNNAFAYSIEKENATAKENRKVNWVDWHSNRWALVNGIIVIASAVISIIVFIVRRHMQKDDPKPI